MADQIQENIKQAFDKLEDKLKSIGFSDEDLDELKADLEVGMKNNASMSDLIGILKDSEKKVITKSKKKSEDKVKDGLMDSTEFKIDYEAPDEVLESTVMEEIEAFEEEARPVLEETINLNNAYFANNSNEEESSFDYKLKGDDMYKIDELTDQSDIYDSIKKRDEEEKKEREKMLYGGTPEETYK
ncbi:hypothetical protein C0585_04410 [Candidatus Woesearchaeota archaeon]|nr:MAG: hypothetical protein C0585_04410 [Candidatus Woesearchaeota archaeon]